ncbi:UPF0262 family protein [Caulobacter segnis]
MSYRRPRQPPGSSRSRSTRGQPSSPPPRSDQEQERQVAIFDLLEGELFPARRRAGRPFYDIRLSLIEIRVWPSISPDPVPETARVGAPRDPAGRCRLFRGVIDDYFLICDSYYSAIRNSTPQPDPRRSGHGPARPAQRGARKPAARASPIADARWSRPTWTPPAGLFTLICALHWQRARVPLS